MDLVGLFEATCERRADATALVWGDRSYRFAEIGEAARRIAGGLHERGVEPGESVAVFLPNGPDNLFAHWGVQLAGAVRVPVNAAYTPREAAHPVRAAECRIVITDDPRRASVDAPTVTVAELLASSPCPRVSVSPEDVAMICFTSGTTGTPKKVPLTHRNLAGNILSLVEVWEWTERDTLLLCLPLMHLHGLANGLHGWIASGCTMILHEKFEAHGALSEIARRRPTMFFGVPAMYHRMLEIEPKPDVSSIRLWVTGSAPLDRSIEERWRQSFGGPLVNRYGMTETVMIAANPARDPRPGSVGRPLAGTEVRIVDGEIVVRGPGVGKVDLDADGFFHTGDLGRLEEGWIFITGRVRDILKCGGTLLSPLEIEEVLLQHPDVAEAAVFGAPDPALGEVPWAVVVPRSGRSLAPDDLGRWAENRLARFKRPRKIRVVTEPMPRNAMQKLDRKKVKELYG